MEANIIKKHTLNDLPSASGIEMVDGIIYIIGDDSQYLYCLDHHLKVLNKIQLFESKEYESGRIPKELKQDLECITVIIIHDQPHLFICGSGANKNRETGYLVKLPTKYNKKHLVRQICLTGLYNLLRANNDIVSAGGSLNLEGAACIAQYFFLLNRTNGATENTVLMFDLEEFLIFINENDEMIPFPKIFQYNLPHISNRRAGFSGASTFENKLFFTASVEETDDAINDGEVLGSYIGYIHITPNVQPREKQKFTLMPQIEDIILLEENKEPFKGKVESIALYESETKNSFIGVAVTDNDLGGSEILMLEIKL